MAKAHELELHSSMSTADLRCVSCSIEHSHRLQNQYKNGRLDSVSGICAHLATRRFHTYDKRLAHSQIFLLFVSHPACTPYLARAPGTIRSRRLQTTHVMASHGSGRWVSQAAMGAVTCTRNRDLHLVLCSSRFLGRHTYMSVPRCCWLHECRLFGGTTYEPRLLLRSSSSWHGVGMFAGPVLQRQCRLDALTQRQLAQSRLIAGADIISQCNATPKISTRNQDAHIAVPLMSQLNRSTLTGHPTSR
jgi:hypothetical protein